MSARRILLRAGVAVASVSAIGVLAGVGGSAEVGGTEGAEASRVKQAKEATRLRAQIRRERAAHHRTLTKVVRQERATRRKAVRRVLRTSRSTGSVDHAIRLGAATYGVSESRLRAVARCESRFNPAASNGQYVGLFQFGGTLWSTTPVAGLSRSDPYAASLAAAWAFSRGMASHWPVCGR